MKIIIETIPHKSHRYETVGDWKFNEWGDLNIKVSDMGDWRYEILVGLHEAIEAHLCKLKGVSEQDITDFDIEFEKKRKKGNTDEPGDDPKAPYKQEHFRATSLERILADYLGVDWKLYDKKIYEL